MGRAGLTAEERRAIREWRAEVRRPLPEMTPVQARYRRGLAMILGALETLETATGEVHPTGSLDSFLAEIAPFLEEHYGEESPQDSLTNARARTQEAINHEFRGEFLSAAYDVGSALLDLLEYARRRGFSPMVELTQAYERRRDSLEGSGWRTQREVRDGT